MKLLLTAAALAVGALAVPTAQLALAYMDEVDAKPAIHDLKPSSRTG